MNDDSPQLGLSMPATTDPSAPASVIPNHRPQDADVAAGILSPSIEARAVRARLLTLEEQVASLQMAVAACERRQMPLIQGKKASP